MCRVLIICTDITCKKAKETLVIGDDIQSFNYLHGHGLQEGKRNFGNCFVQIL